MKRHVRLYNTGYYLCGLKVGEQPNGTFKDQSCYQCSCESRHLLYKMNGKLASKFLQKLLDKENSQL